MLKHWINDHNSGEATGGLAKLGSVYANGVTYGEYPAGSPEAGKQFIHTWGTSGPHAMTIVGYNNDVRFDYNNDGQYTDTIDINNDGKVNMWDWEIGAVKLANSWGPLWPTQFDEGYIYMPYNLFGTTTSGGPNFKVLVCEAEASHETEITYKASVAHENRGKLGICPGYGNTANDDEPVAWYNGRTFASQGGNYSMNGITNDPLELAYDFSYWYGNEDVGKIFMVIANAGGIFTAYFDYLSIIDYRWDQEFELYYRESPFIVGPGLNYLGINYDLIPHETNITSNLTFDSDMVSRFNPTVGSNATLTIDDGVQIDMYNSELEILSNASLVIDDNATFIAKDGICKITSRWFGKYR